jgi:undecaprenyl-diphosphatase
MSTTTLHQTPPATPSSFFRHRLGLLGLMGAGFAALALAAAVHHGWLPLQWDLPIQRFVEAQRTSALTSVFLTISRLGSTLVVIALSAVLAIVSWPRCRAVSIAIAGAALARPLLEFVLKDLVGRARPDLDPLVAGTGHSFPSGHVLAAIALYGLLPVVVALFTRRRALWWASVVGSGTLIAGIAASRVYLGVHWFSDVVGSLLLGSFFLLAVEHAVHALHERADCRSAQGDANAATATIGAEWGLPPREPKNGLSEKLKMPPSAATIR